MKKLLMSLLSLLALTFSACDDDDVPDYPDTKLIKGQPRLELTWYDALDSDDLWDATEYYIVVKLTPTEMWLKPHQKGVNADIKNFIRRNDLPVPSMQFPNQ